MIMQLDPGERYVRPVFISDIYKKLLSNANTYYKDICMQVLLVEDDVALVGLLKSNLTLRGHEVCCVSDGVSAVQHVLEHTPEMMILDLGLPMMDGLEVLGLLKGRLQGTSVMVLTARVSLTDRIRALELGADDCMSKPFSFREFQARYDAITR